MTSRTALVFGVFIAISTSATFSGVARPVFAASWGLWNDPHGDIVKPVPRPAPEQPPVVSPKAEVPSVPSPGPEKISDTSVPVAKPETASLKPETNIQHSVEGSTPSDGATVAPAVADTADVVVSGKAPESPASTVIEVPGKEVPVVATENAGGTTETRQPAEASLPAETTAGVNEAPVQDQGAGNTGVADQVTAANEVLANPEVSAANAVVPPSVVEQVAAVPRQTGDVYVIGSGDVLDIAVWRDESLTKTVVVLPDGTIAFPLIGGVKAAGRTVEQLTEEIRRRLSGYVTDLTLSVEVRQANSMMIFVVGKVNSPGRHPISAPVNVLQALAMAGGVNPFAKKDDIKIFRQEEGKTVIYPFTYNEVSRGNRLEENIVLKRGDLIVVP